VKIGCVVTVVDVVDVVGVEVLVVEPVCVVVVPG
jgi:hypothetical protein